VTPAVEVDCRDLPCPRPIIELTKALPGVAVGDLLAVVARDPAARHEVPAWCRMRGQEYLGADTAVDGVARYLVRRTGGG
jgi:tRNA 2-thiouridine synthesizing protein A